ncbi:dual-action HEIGH metallo-peptidase [Leifsonia sp. 115AMFTsu3.1]|nr:dual-action HEIGH metallo-peptidase [Leifsonia sp. 115AMFTsu3.1]
MEPAAAWARSGYACRTYPTTATLYIKYPPTVPATYRASLRKAAEAWSAWRYVTGVTITFGDLADPTPAGARVVGVASMPNIPGQPRAQAVAATYCDFHSGQPAGGNISIATNYMGSYSETLRQHIFTHEIGHILGLNHNTDQLACGTVMEPTSSEGSICGDNKAPYIDDVAGVLALWRPNATPGFPAGSRITFNRDPSWHLESSTARWSGWANGVTFTTGLSDGYWDWTYVKDNANDGWGWLVNSASGLCLTRNAGADQPHMGWCSGDGARWAVWQGANGMKLLGKGTRTCLGIMLGQNLFRRNWGDSMPCSDYRSDLQIVKMTTARTKRSLPDAETTGGAVIGAGSGRCLTAQGGPYTPGTDVTISSCAGAAAQKWRFDPVENGYRISVFNTTADFEDEEQAQSDGEDPAMCLSGSGESVGTAACQRTSAMTWTVAADGTLRNQGSGTCLNVRGAATGDGSRLMLYPCSTASNMVWSSPESLTSGPVSLAPVSSAGGVLSTTPAATGDADQRIRTVLKKDAGSNTARFQYEQVGNTGGGLIRNADTGTCLRWKGNGAQAVLDHACDGSDSSYRWGPTTVGAGVWKLQSQYTGECLDLFGATDAENNTIGTYACNGASNQTWRAIPNNPVWPAGTDTTDPPNIAVFGTATQSSTRDAIDSPADKANDGDMGNTSVARTINDAYPWWQLDFGQTTQIDTVTVHLPTDGSHWLRSTDFWVIASNDPIPDGNPSSLSGGEHQDRAHLPPLGTRDRRPAERQLPLRQNRKRLGIPALSRGGHDHPASRNVNRARGRSNLQPWPP